jgi:hypothetical protein
MSALNIGGYDAAQTRREEDDLDRWRFAADIVEVVMATPPDWSARIGIFGKWGEGKSTVLRFAEGMLKKKENIVFWFSPWATQNWDDLWKEFGTCLLEALEGAKIPCEDGLKKTVRTIERKLETSSVGQVVETAAAFFGKERVYDAAFGALNRWLRCDGEQIRAIREKLQGRRLVVLIDDLDRCDPDLIPQLLLSLRELLDLPGFTFLLAFDDDIVSRSLTIKNPAWGDGLNFLEKILDFRFYLPAVTQSQKNRFIQRAIDKYCSFVPQESTKQIQDLLPTNPRKLKALIRSLTALQPQIHRHDQDELNWIDMWLAQMIRHESYAFFECLLEGDTLDKETGVYYQIITAREKKGDARNQRLKELIDESGVKDPEVLQRLVHLIEAVRSRSSFRFQYVCELAVRPRAVTWKEFRSFYSVWAADRKPSTLSNWIQRHSNERGVSVEDVENELFETIMTRRNECLSTGAESASIDEHDSSIGEAGILLELIRQDLLSLDKLNALRFKQIYGQAIYWIGFRKNPTDKALRDQDEQLLLELLSSASDALSTELFEVVVPQHWHPGFGEGDTEKRDLNRKCLEIVASKAAREAITFVTREGGIRSLSEHGRFPAVKYCLFNSESPIWKTALREDVLGLIREGRENLTIYSNVRDLFSFLVQGLDHGVDSISKKEFTALLPSEGFVRSIWECLTSRGIQYRMQMSIIQGRQTLIQNGVPEGLLPMTEELQRRMREAEPHPSNTGPMVAQDAPPDTPQ